MRVLYIDSELNGIRRRMRHGEMGGAVEPYEGRRHAQRADEIAQREKVHCNVGPPTVHGCVL